MYVHGIKETKKVLLGPSVLASLPSGREASALVSAIAIVSETSLRLVILLVYGTFRD